MINKVKNFKFWITDLWIFGELIIVQIHRNACVITPMYECSHTTELWCMNHRRPMVADESLFEVAGEPMNWYIYLIPNLCIEYFHKTKIFLLFASIFCICSFYGLRMLIFITRQINSLSLCPTHTHTHTHTHFTASLSLSFSN